MDSTEVIKQSFSDMPQLNSWERLFLHALQHLQDGQIRVRLADGTVTELGKGGEESVTLTLHDRLVAKSLLLGGGMALAETYIHGRWSTSDLSGLLRVLARSQRDMGRLARGTSKVLRGMDRFAHRLRANTRKNARRNIQEHYDLSNRLYESFLDPTLTYSAAVFEQPGESLESAQFRKLDRLIDQLQPRPEDHVLEIGSGWGSCAIRLALRCGCRVTSLTLSDQQAAEARRRVKAAGLEARVDIRIQDYRDVQGDFDHVISIEMIEAVGHEFLADYFQTVNARLKSGGRFAMQAITIPDERYRDYNRSVDFIRKHIFPGGHLPSPGVLEDLRKTKTSLQLIDAFEFGKDYAETLRRWCGNFLGRRGEVHALGFDEEFVRKWQYYLCYCEAGFDTGLIHVRQLCYRKD